MSNMDILKEYYKRVCVPLVFLGEHVLTSCQNAKVYLYDFQLEEELLNFKKVFQEYIPFYVKNFDRIERYELEKTDNEIGEYLKEKAKGIKKRNEIPNRPVESNGLYGELFNDFYLRNVLSSDRLITFLAKKSYECPNSESHGIDIVVCSLKENELEITFSEAKFVVTLSSAKEKLKNDISAHINTEYINNYLQFVMQRQSDVVNERKKIINEKINEFNDLIEDENITFIETLNRKNCHAKFVFFAIFNAKNRTEIFYEGRITEIIDVFNNKIIETGIEKYSIEVVFVPTFNKTMELKNKMEEWDE